MRELPLILSLDTGGRPIEWLPWQDVACLYVRNQIAWTAGEAEFIVHGGYNNHQRSSSQLILNSIVAIRGARSSYTSQLAPTLVNRELFRRDHHTCLYCGDRFPVSALTRDHIIPLGLGGRNSWENVVTACKPCNQRKSCRTPERANMPLLALPYTPSRVEYLILANRRILSDQMAFLTAHAPKKNGRRLYS